MASGPHCPRVDCARTHEQARQAVCCVCDRKPKQYKDKKAITVVNEKQCELVHCLLTLSTTNKTPATPQLCV